MDVIFYLNYYWNWLAAEFSAYPPIIKMTIVMTSILVVLYTSALVRLILVHRSKRKFENTLKKLKKDLEEHLISALYTKRMYQERELEELFNVSTSLVKNKREKRAFTKYIIELVEARQQEGHRVNLSNYVTVLDVFGIIDFWNKLMSSRKPKIRQEAIRTLDDLNIGLTGAAIQQSLYHKNNSLRKNARATLMKYDLNDPYRFLEEGFDQGFNAMDEVRLHYFFSEQHQKGALPQLMRWTNTSNPHYKAFLVREIGFFKQEQSAPALLELFVAERSGKVKCAIVEALAIMNYQPSKEVFIEHFKLSTSPVQLAIIKAMPQFGGEDSLDFLVGLYSDTFDSDSKIQLGYSIGQFGPKGKRRLKEVVGNRDIFDKQVYAEVDYHLN